MKNLFYTLFFVSLTLSAGSNNQGSNFTYLRVLHASHPLGFCGNREGIMHRYPTPLDHLEPHSLLQHGRPWKLITPGLSFIAQWRAFEHMLQQDETRRNAYQRAISLMSSTDRDNKNLRLENTYLRNQLQTLRTETEDQEFVTPPSSPTSATPAHKTLYTHKLVHILIGCWTLCLISLKASQPF